MQPSISEQTPTKLGLTWRGCAQNLSIAVSIFEAIL
jgi:hypothetical protein